MKTNETMKRALVQEAEQEILNLLEQMQGLEEGNFKELEQQVLSSSLAIGKRMLEQILTQAEEEQGQPARKQGACGHRQRLVGHRPKQVLTMLGSMTIKRAYYQCLLPKARTDDPSCSHGEAPFDTLWGLNTGRTSPGVQKTISFLSASMTLAEATEVFCSLLPLDLSERQALNLLQPVGEAFIQQEDEQVGHLFEQAQDKRLLIEEQADNHRPPLRRLYIELDGILARLRRGSVPMEKPEREREGDVYREVKVGAVFTAMPGQHRSALVNGVFVDEPEAIKYMARRTDAQTFGRLLYQLAHQCGITRAEQVIVLGDGATWIRRLVAEHFPQAVHIVDLYHARQHVWKVAHAVYGRGTSQAVCWAEQVCDLLSEGQIEEVVDWIERLPPIAPDEGASQSIPEIEAAYFRRNRQRMRYPAFRAQGIHIGSGIAEAACKTVVATRAKRSGMRWTPKGLDAILALRTAVLNRSYEAFWKQRGHRCA